MLVLNLPAFENKNCPQGEIATKKNQSKRLELTQDFLTIYNDINPLLTKGDI